MTYTFKLSRRIARLRVPLAAALMLATAGCDNTKSLEPTIPDASDAGPTGGSAPSAFAGGIPFGIFALPTSQFGNRYNGAVENIWPESLLEELAEIKARGGKAALMFAGNQDHYKEDGHFSFTKWKARIDRFKGTNFSAYVKDGTIIGHYLIDEPYDPANWNGQPVPPSVLEEMARYSKQLWPDMVTIVRAEPSYLGTNHHYLDAAWAQYLERKGTAADYIRTNVAEAQKRGLGLIVGLNILRGGIPNNSAMTASEVEAWGSALLSSTYPCAFISWTYDAGYLSSGSIQSAMDALRRMAQNRSTRSCRGVAGGETPPPPPPPDTDPDSGVPFGPWGLPADQMDSFSGAARGATPSTVLATARAARTAGARVVLRLSPSDVTNADGTFSLAKWKAAIDRYAGIDLSSFVNDGTIAGHLLVRNPQAAGAWGGRQISYATLEEMARYSRQRWPALPTIVQAPPSWLDANPSAWQYLDASSVIYAGSAGDPAAWISKQASAAGGARLGLLVDMNVLDGGTSASGIPGTTQGKYAMSASQLQSWGSALVAQSRVCALLLHRYDAGYFGRSDVKQAVVTLVGKASARAATSCRVRS
jgi:hypothetical protein